MAPLVEPSAPSPWPELDSRLSRDRISRFLTNQIRPTLAQRSFKTAALIWSGLLVASAAWVWDTGLGALPLVERPIGMLALAGAAAVLGFVLRTWLWPITVSTIWLLTVGGSQLWMLASAGHDAYLERWRAIAPTRYHSSLFSPDKTQFTTADILALVLAAAAIPCAGAIAGVLTVRGPANERDWLMALAAAFLTGVAIVTASEYEFMGLVLLAVPVAFVSGLVVGRWYWSGLAVACVGLGVSLVIAVRLLAHGIATEWRTMAIDGVPGLFSKTYPSFADVVLAGWQTALYLVLPAVLLGQVIRWFVASARRHQAKTDRRLPPQGAGLPPGDTAGA